MKKYLPLILFVCIFAAIANAQNFSKFEVTDNAGKKGLNGLAHRPGAKVVDILVPEDFNTANVTVDFALEGNGILSGTMPVDFSTPQTVKTKKDAAASDTEWTVTLRKVKPAELPLFLDFSQDNLSTAGWDENTEGWAWAAIDTGQSKVIRYGNLTATFIVAFSTAPRNVSYSLNTVGSAFGDALFHVYASADGETWNALRTFDSTNQIPTTSQSYTDELSEDIRYVKWIYTKRVVNVNLNNIAVLPRDIVGPIEPENPYDPDFNPPHEIEGMELVWNDEFNYNGKPNPSNWQYESGFVRNNELQWYKSDNVICKDGVLLIEAKRERIPNPNYEAGSSDWKKNREYAEYTSGSISTQKLKDFKYGRYEIRARIDTTLGSWPAIWGKGISGSWPYCGEIDIMEFYRRSKDPERPVILANLAWGSETNPEGFWNTGRFPLSDFTENDDEWCNKFHIWRMDWDADSIKLYLDDQLLNKQDLSEAINPAGSNPMEPFQQNFYFMLNLAIGSNGGDPENSPFPIKYEVDYFRVYQSKPPTNISNPVLADVRLYPNPAQNVLNIESNEDIQEIMISDITGKIMLQTAFTNRIDMGDYASGMYIIRLTTDNGNSETFKILKK